MWHIMVGITYSEKKEIQLFLFFLGNALLWVAVLESEQKKTPERCCSQRHLSCGWPGRGKEGGRKGQATIYCYFVSKKDEREGSGGLGVA